MGTLRRICSFECNYRCSSTLRSKTVAEATMKSALVVLCLLSLAVSEAKLRAEQERGEVPTSDNRDQYDQELEMRDESWPSCTCGKMGNSLYECYCSGSGRDVTYMDYCSCRTSDAYPPPRNYMYRCQDCSCTNESSV